VGGAEPARRRRERLPDRGRREPGPRDHGALRPARPAARRQAGRAGRRRRGAERRPADAAAATEGAGIAELSNPRDLFLLELAELLWIERILEFQALPKLRDEARDEELRQAFVQHLEETRRHVGRVEQAFLSLRAEPASARSAALESLLQQHDEQAANVKEPRLRDLFHAGGGIRAEHLELAVYESVIGLAETLAYSQPAELLAKNRQDEERALELLEQLARKLRAELNK
jgi:ferritin-like metal-binding protein YciE